jgi:hypothetical protein
MRVFYASIGCLNTTHRPWPTTAASAVILALTGKSMVVPPTFTGFIRLDAPRVCWWNFEEKNIPRFAVAPLSLSVYIYYITAAYFINHLIPLHLHLVSSQSWPQISKIWAQIESEVVTRTYQSHCDCYPWRFLQALPQCGRVAQSWKD